MLCLSSSYSWHDDLLLIDIWEANVSSASVIIWLAGGNGPHLTLGLLDHSFSGTSALLGGLGPTGVQSAAAVDDASEGDPLCEEWGC